MTQIKDLTAHGTPDGSEKVPVQKSDDSTVYTTIQQMIDTLGVTGDTGAAGSDGADGDAAGVLFTFDNTTAMADPGAGKVRFNNGTIGSVTAIAFDATSASTGNPDVSAYIATWADSTSTVKGHIIAVKEGTPATYCVFTVSAVADNTGWLEVTVANVDGVIFANADNVRFIFVRTGDKGDTGDTGATGATGATGPAGADGADGNMAGPLSSTDNAAARFDGTDGTTVQDSGVIIDDSNNVSGVATLTTTGGIELGHASDTTIARTGAGAIAVEGVAVATASNTMTFTNKSLSQSQVTSKTKSVSLRVTAAATACATGDAQATIRIPAEINGWDLTDVEAYADTAGTTGTMDIQIRNVTQAADMLTTKITLDSTEASSLTAATAPVIDTANDDVATGDQIAIDVDAVQTTPANGLEVVLTFTQV